MAKRPQHYEVIIVGGGPAGLSAGIYTARARLDSLLIEKGLVGGQVVNAERLDNYPGFPEVKAEPQNRVDGDTLVPALSSMLGYCATEESRPVLSGEHIVANARTYFDQSGKLLDSSDEKI